MLDIAGLERLVGDSARPARTQRSTSPRKTRPRHSTLSGERACSTPAAPSTRSALSMSAWAGSGA
jgi:hypothetical protein